MTLNSSVGEYDINGSCSGQMPSEDDMRSHYGDLLGNSGATESSESEDQESK